MIPIAQPTSDPYITPPMQDAMYFAQTNRKFTEIWPDVTSFVADYKDCQLPMSTYFVAYNDATVPMIYYLLFAKYGNSTIASFDETQFKYQIFTTILNYGPAWLERIKLQKEARALTTDQITEGSTAIYNHAFNPETTPTTQTTTELSYINEQNVTKYKKPKIDAIMLKWQMMDTDVTEPFLAKFKKYFVMFAGASHQIAYPDIWEEVYL